MSKNILIFLEHDFIIRNFLDSKVFRTLEKIHNVNYVFPSTKTKRFSDKLPLKKNYLTCIIDLKRDYLIKRLYHLIGIKDLSIRDKKDKKIMTFFYKSSLKKFYYFDNLLSFSLLYQITLFFYKTLIGNNRLLEDFILRKNTDLIIHPTVLNGHFAYDLVKIAKKNKLPCFFLMNSWDNPSTKPFSGSKPDKLFVWGEQTYNHAIKYLRMKKEDIVISGAAQFEIYRDTIFDDYNKNYDKPICFAGSSKGLDEIQLLKNIDMKINNKKIIYKPHPWKSFSKNEKNFFDISFKNTSMFERSIEEYKDYYKTRSFNLSKSNLLSNIELFKNISLLVCPISTILLEAIINNIPVILFDPKIDENENSHHFIARTRVQYTEMFDYLQPIVAKDNDELILKINNLMSSRDTYDAYLKKLKKNMKYFIKFDNESYDTKLLNVINEM